MGTDGEVAAVGGEGHNLDPLLGVGEEVRLDGEVGLSSDGDATVVGSDSNPVNADGDSAGALRVGEAREGGGASANRLGAVRDLDGL